MWQQARFENAVSEEMAIGRLNVFFFFFFLVRIWVGSRSLLLEGIHTVPLLSVLPCFAYYIFLFTLIVVTFILSSKIDLLIGNKNLLTHNVFLVY